MILFFIFIFIIYHLFIIIIIFFSRIYIPLFGLSKFIESLQNINIYLYRFNKKVYILFLRSNPFVFYYSFFRFIIRDSFYTSSGICGFILRLHKGWFRFTLICNSKYISGHLTAAADI